jgi:hypothetical protein
MHSHYHHHQHCSALLLLLLLVCAGFPEDFVPFLEYDEAVNAKY